MSSVILLSSSPHRIFARSPTQAESPQQPRSPGGGSNLNVCRRSSFRNASQNSEGFTPTFTTARQILGTKSGAKNSPMGTPRRNKFRSSICQDIEDTTSLRSEQGVFATEDAARPKIPRFHNELVDDIDETDQHICVQILPSDVRRKKKTAQPKSKPVANKAVARRKDWTPPRLPNRSEDEEGMAESARFPGEFLQSFQCDWSGANSVSDHETTKRRKVEIAKPEKTSSTTSKQKSTTAQMSNSKARKRNISPTKKNLTITGLATANYSGLTEKNNTPMMQYLVSTQAQSVEETSDGTLLQTKVRKRKQVSKNSQPKTNLVSPTSALKTFDDQDVIFASASQLMRDQSPTLLRDTVEATKQSEANLQSPVPTQHTAPMSIESDTPRLSISRFRGRRNLWNAADRDEDEALLHNDDPFNLKSLTSVFAGKDAMIENGQTVSSERRVGIPTDSLHLLKNNPFTTFDIDDITTPDESRRNSYVPKTQERSLHTHTPKEEDEQSFGPTTDKAHPHPSLQTDCQPPSAKEPAPPMPNYAGFSDEDLKKQLVSYGFKRMRKRERMIATLQKCWIDKYGLPEEAPVSMRHGDFLSSIHGISNRRTPKIKKPRARKRKEVQDNSMGVALPNMQGGLAKSDILREEEIYDVSDVEEMGYFDRISKIPTIAEPDPELPSFTGVGRSKVAKNQAKLPTPPSTVSLITIPSSSPAFEDPATSQDPLPSPQQSFENAQDTQATDDSLSQEDLPDIKIQVERAIKHSSTIARNQVVPRNHQTDPTFHEKILMYDPIVLEDLTAWLNIEGLNAIGEDREVDIMEVRAWCENNGVCCLWKGGWRGRGLKAKADDGD